MGRFDRIQCITRVTVLSENKISFKNFCFENKPIGLTTTRPYFMIVSYDGIATAQTDSKSIGSGFLKYLYVQTYYVIRQTFMVPPRRCVSVKKKIDDS